ncbi:hypothetical protein [Francisella marina]|uniref:hypothetical protein n=1 Tax=Francisella marina TaxID=2249302 RepID=UPI0011EE5E80|nr:hypothetical protein [Francisella marina]QEO58307.1 hypothetical protein F0R75_00420 [Francisella marina]
MKSMIVNNGWWNDLSAEKIFEYIEEEIVNWHGLSLEDVREQLHLSPVEVIEKYDSEEDKSIIKESVIATENDVDVIEKVIKSLEILLDDKKELLRRFRVAYSTQINMDDPYWAKKTDERAQMSLLD